MEIYLIRHFMTQGNLEKRYIGSTDEPILWREEYITERQAVEGLAVSPLKRCRQTAEIYFPGVRQVVQEKLRETDFGLFENKNHEELKELEEYRRWLDSRGTLPFPGGESHRAFLKRCREGFEETVGQFLSEGKQTAAFVVHGGTIMAILSQLSERRSSFYDWMVENGGGFRAWLDEDGWRAGNHRLKGIEKL